MFQAGYQWRKWEPSETNAASAQRGRKGVLTPRDSMIGKI
jgi:hypothetical protein